MNTRSKSGGKPPVVPKRGGTDFERVAAAILRHAQKHLGERFPIDLFSTATEFEGEHLNLDLPIAPDLCVPIKVDVDDQRSAAVYRMEGRYLASAIEDHLRRHDETTRRLARIGQAASRFARRASIEGFPIAVKKIGVTRETSTWACASDMVDVEFEILGPDMRPNLYTVEVGSVADLRDDVEGIVDGLRQRVKRLEVVRRHGGVALIDPVAHAAMSAFGIDCADMMKRSPDTPRQPTHSPEILPAHFTHHWNDGILLASFCLGERAKWDRGTLFLKMRLPETSLLAAAGRPLTDLASHPILANAVVARAAVSSDCILVQTEPLAPLVLLSDGTAIGVPDGDALIADHEVVRVQVGLTRRQVTSMEVRRS